MNVGYKPNLENPIQSANFISKLFFGWPIQIIRKATIRGLDVSDLYKTLASDKSKGLGDELENNWRAELQRAKMNNIEPSLMRTLSKTYLFDYMMWGLVYFIHILVSRSCQPIVLSYLLLLFNEENNQENRTHMYLLSTLLVAISIGIALTFHHYCFGVTKIGMRMRVALSSLVYRKLTRLSQKALTETASGQVVNLLSNDLNRFDQVLLYLHIIWIMPFQIILITFFLWEEVQMSSLVGVVSMIVLSLPGQCFLGKIIGHLRYSIGKKSDKRVKLMNEIITGIQVIKMYAWEDFFEKIINAVRLDEIRDLTSNSYIRGVLTSFNIFIDKTTLFLTVIAYVMSGNIITASKIFAMAQFYNVLRITLTFFFPLAIRFGAETIVSVKRILEFLLLEERQANEGIREKGDHGICLSNVTASWTTKDDIKNMSLNIPKGSLCAIVGAVGAGKSSILQLLLGELSLKSGTVSMGGDISYASQEPWLFSSTVRNNILFGQAYDRTWYQEVVKICALRSDFDQFPYRDQTIVGDRGVSLSGGQRARINLARAIYRKSDIYLLDDPLSAVDTHVSRHLFEQCIQKHLDGKTRVLVTHQLQYLQEADLVVVVQDGKILAQGTLKELQKSDIDLTKMFVSFNDGTEKSNEEDAKDSRRLQFSKSSRFSKLSIMSDKSYSDASVIGDGVMDEEVGVNGDRSPFLEYFRATNNKCLVVAVSSTMVIAQTFCSAIDFWVAFWTEQEHLRHSVNTTNEESFPMFVTLSNVTNTSQYYTNNVSPSGLYETIEVGNTIHHLLKTNYSIYLYTALVVAAMITTLLRSLGFFRVCMQSSINLHSRMFHGLLRAPMNFFDSTPSGRILNRFSKDLGAIDENLPEATLIAASILLIISGVLVNVAIANQYTIIALVVLGFLQWKIFSWYLTTGKYIKHLEGSMKSPVLSHVNSTMRGIMTIRAAEATEEHVRQFDDHQDVHTSPWYLTLALTSAFGLWMDVVCAIFIAVTSYSSVYLQTIGVIQSSLAGLAISQSLILSGMLQNGIKQAVDVIYQLTNVERVLQYTSLEPEGQFESEISKKLSTSGSWPSGGRIEVRKLYLTYAGNSPPVLKNLNFTVQPGEKIGIVGRTGAGKSSIINALFRLTGIEGSILIDGVNTNVIGLTQLRNAISIIPQEPVLFSTTIRHNLDPFKQFDDARLWNALDQVKLKEAVSSLGVLVIDGGTNFSLGQRQLICLARAILKNNKILVLDEATANVDQRTDSLIQNIIRERFAKCTVLTIAHRLNTIMYCDKILVMDFGVIAEFDHPHELLQLPDGTFHKMVLETGPMMSEVLKKMAREAYHKVDQITVI